ncbi:MAG: winged helix-turn-helix transcriptional regulator [Clostridia bacterium]|nr:winged helix-turn-helix transcriptional regulator [Clostridia bacterium]
MARQIAVLTENGFLFQKIYLILRERGYSVVRESYGADILLVDTDTHEPPDSALPTITISRSADADLHMPFGEEGLFAALDSKLSGGSPALRLGKKCAYLRDTEIRLTEVEFSLLSELTAHSGYVSREELLDKVWGGDADGGVLNVYIHYLREKLELFGEKIIISSRKQGYKVDEKYLSSGVKRDA